MKRRNQRRMTRQASSATTRINNNTSSEANRSSNSCSSSESDSDEIEITTGVRQSDNMHDNHGFVSDFDSSLRAFNPGLIINRKYDDSSRFFNLKISNQNNNNTNNINTISSSIDYTLNVDEHYLAEQEQPGQQDDEQEIIVAQAQDDQSVQIDLENTNQIGTLIEEISTLSNCSILSDVVDDDDDVLNQDTHRIEINSIDEIPPNYEQIITGEHNC